MIFFKGTAEYMNMIWISHNMIVIPNGFDLEQLKHELY